jgi:hypothetical protein
MIPGGLRGACTRQQGRPEKTPRSSGGGRAGQEVNAGLGQYHYDKRPTRPLTDIDDASVKGTGVANAQTMRVFVRSERAG